MTEQQAAPRQADLRQRILEAQHAILHAALSARWPTSTGLVAIEQTDAVLAVVGPELAALREQLATTQAENGRLRALLAHDHAAAYHQGEPRNGLLWHCGRDHCTAPNDQPSAASLPAEPGNAEDCPQCRERRDLPYPFLCPGHPTA